MAIKEIKREWSPCQLDYVKTYLLHSEKDVADLPECCVGSKATVSETDNEYFCTVDGWKLSAEIEPGMGGGGSAGGGNAGGGGVFVVNAEADNMDDNPFNATIDKTFAEIEEAHNAGQLVQMHIMIMGMQAIIPLTLFVTGQAAMFQSLFMGYHLAVTVQANGSVEGEIIQLETRT